MNRLRLWSLVALVVPAACGVGHSEKPAVAPEAAETAPASAVPVPLEVPDAETREDRLNRRRDAILAAPPCIIPPPVDTIGWKPQTIGNQPASLRLPPEFRLDTAVDFYHGGLQWRAGARTFYLQNGWWGVDTPSACRATFEAGDYIVEQYDVEGQLALSAFPADTVWRPSIAVGGRATTQAELAVLWTILRSMPPSPRR